MAETEIRTCPHCGVSISWNTPYCPNCDQKLAVENPVENEADDIPQPALDDAQVMTVLGAETDDASVEEVIADKLTMLDDLPDFPSKLPERLATQLPIEPDDTSDIETTPLTEANVFGADNSDEDETVFETNDEDFATELGELPDGDMIRGNIDQTVTMVDEVDVFETVEEPIPVNPASDSQPETKQDIPLPYQAVATDVSQDEDLPDIKTRGLPADLDALSTLPASHSAIAGSSPVAPAARVPEPEPLPPLDAESGAGRAPTHQMQAVVIPSAPFTPPPPVANYQTAQQPTYQAPAMPSPYSPAPQAMPYSYQQAGYQAQTGYAPQSYQQPQYAQQQPVQPAMPNDYWLNQRVQAYQLAGYELVGRNQYEGLLRQSKTLPFFWWIVAGWTIFGAAWYFLILLTTGFNKDKVYIGLEPDGYIFEEGAGSAHVRRKRERSGRRWGGGGSDYDSALHHFVFPVTFSGLFHSG